MVERTRRRRERHSLWEITPYGFVVFGLLVAAQAGTDFSQGQYVSASLEAVTSGILGGFGMRIHGGWTESKLIYKLNKTKKIPKF